MNKFNGSEFLYAAFGGKRKVNAYASFFLLLLITTGLSFIHNFPVIAHAFSIISFLGYAALASYGVFRVVCHIRRTNK